jgi:S-(hydroxymethyl)glutathione dehydrogenase / alcohol dehydrogenase
LIEPLITHTLKLENVNHGLELMQRGDSIRSVVVY